MEVADKVRDLGNELSEVGVGEHIMLQEEV